MLENVFRGFPCKVCGRVPVVIVTQWTSVAPVLGCSAAVARLPACERNRPSVIVLEKKHALFEQSDWKHYTFVQWNVKNFNLHFVNRYVCTV